MQLPRLRVGFEALADNTLLVDRPTRKILTMEASIPVGRTSQVYSPGLQGGTPTRTCFVSPPWQPLSARPGRPICEWPRTSTWRTLARRPTHPGPALRWLLRCTARSAIPVAPWPGGGSSRALRTASSVVLLPCHSSSETLRYHAVYISLAVRLAVFRAKRRWRERRQSNASRA
jgi:hypothetical protein